MGIETHNPALSYLLTLGSPKSRESVRYTLSRIARLYGQTIDSFDWAGLTPHQVLDIIARLEEEGLSYRTINGALSALKGVARQAWRDGLMDGDTLERIKDIESRRGLRLPKGRALDAPEVDALLRACDCLNGPDAPGRARVVLLLGIDAGLRRSEIGALRPEDVSFKDVRLRVEGKGNKEREVPLSRRLAGALEDWMKIRAAAKARGVQGDKLLGRLNRNGELIELNGMGGFAIGHLVKQVALLAGLPEDRIPTPHDMRRTAITNWLERGNVRVAQALAGHDHVQTTMSYDRGDLEEIKRKVVEP